ncbi:Muc22p [Hypocenomyce scalaris]|nr:Muc22p [Hypocenomyce scalaris]
MKTPTVATVLATSVGLASSQISFSNATNSFVCPASGGSFCAGNSLTTNIIIRCSGIVGTPGNCDDNLAGVPPVGVKDYAPCYQSSPTTGDAACSYNGTVYPDTGYPYPVSSVTITTTATIFSDPCTDDVACEPVTTSTATLPSMNCTTGTCSTSSSTTTNYRLALIASTTNSASSPLAAAPGLTSSTTASSLLPSSSPPISTPILKSTSFYTLFPTAIIPIPGTAASAAASSSFFHAAGIYTNSTLPAASASATPIPSNFTASNLGSPASASSTGTFATVRITTTSTTNIGATTGMPPSLFIGTQTATVMATGTTTVPSGSISTEKPKTGSWGEKKRVERVWLMAALGLAVGMLL